MNKKTAQKWQKMKKQKEEVNESSTALNFKTHFIDVSQADVIIPKQYTQFLKNPQRILIIQCNKEKLIVQVGAHNTKDAQQKNEISVLKTLLDLHGIQCGPTGVFKGQIRSLNPNKISEYSLEIVQLLVKDTYFSRRDQYKVMKALKQSITHVYLRKTLEFDEISLEVNAMLKNNHSMVKTGIIDKNTKIIFRSNCTKTTIGIQISTETFQLNENKQLYLQKMIEFIYFFLHRNNYFNNTHRLTLIFFGRCFYPQFKTLTAAYQYLAKENTTLDDHQKYETNFSVALQKDFRGRIFQDVYRRIIWSSDMIDNFRQFFWQKISEFLFTLNWNVTSNQNNIGKFITKSLQMKINQTHTREGLLIGEQPNSTANFRVKPFLHKMKSTLANSRDSNVFEAISLISQQYRHHYKFRSLSETGNSIIILSAGSSNYEVDQLSYKMAKSYIYLTNIRCSLVNFAKKTKGPLKADIAYFKIKPIFKMEDKKKMENLTLNCIQKQVYMSPTNQDMIVWDYFQNKSMIYPEQITQMEASQSDRLRQHHSCNVEPHYELIQSIVLQNRKDYQIRSKDVSFITVQNMDDNCLYIHEILYASLKINRLNYTNQDLKHKMTDLDVFEIDLNKIMLNKKDWAIEKKQNQISNQTNIYLNYLERFKNNNKDQRHKEVEKVNKNIFKIYNQLEENKQQDKLFLETMSNDQFNVGDNQILLQDRKKKNSGTYHSQIIDLTEKTISQKEGKVNIFQETFRNKNHQYTAGEKNTKTHKKIITHNKERTKNLFLQSNIHYLLPYYNEIILKKYKAFIKKQYIQDYKEEASKISALFQMEKTWKNLCFPLLTPIYTRFNIKQLDNLSMHIDSGVIDENNDGKINILEDQICKLLMKNFQITQLETHYNIHNYAKLSKGQVICRLGKDGVNLNKQYFIDKQHQNKIIPFMLYRYLSYEDKDCRFCTKYVYFEDKNYYDLSKKIELETKTVKIVLAYKDVNNVYSEIDSLSSTGLQFKKSQNIRGSFDAVAKKQKDPFQDFIKIFNEKYKEFSIELTKNKPLSQPLKKRIILNFSKRELKVLYNHEQIEIEINTQYNFSSLFEILVSWNLCSSVIVNDFVQNVMTLGRRSNLKPFLITAGNIFNTVWSISTIGQITFEHKIGVQMLERNILSGGEWLWDSNGYYLHISGISFIQVKKDKKLILWRDNNNEKRNRDIKKDDSCKQYNKFFMKAAVFDFIGGIIDKIIYSPENGKN